MCPTLLVTVSLASKSKELKVLAMAGETFGSDVACEKGTLLYMFYAGNLAVLLFKNPF